MTIHFHLEFEDLTAFQQNVIEHAHTHKIKKAYFKWITSIILFLLVLFLTTTSLITIVTSLIIAIIYFMVFPFLYAKVTFFKLRKQMQKNDYSHVLGACDMTFLEDGITRQLKNKTTHFDWKEFINWREDSSHYFLYVSDLEGLIIPKNPDNMTDKETTAYNDYIQLQLNSKF